MTAPIKLVKTFNPLHADGNAWAVYKRSFVRGNTLGDLWQRVAEGERRD